ncbi:MAG: hypothetical protein WAW80_05205 [Candidatus Saccharimonadales bacterium]
MAKVDETIIDKFKDELSKKDEIPDNLLKAITLELAKDSPNAERLAGIIQLKKEYLGDD